MGGRLSKQKILQAIHAANKYKATPNLYLLIAFLPIKTNDWNEAMKTEQSYIKIQMLNMLRLQMFKAGKMLRCTCSVRCGKYNENVKGYKNPVSYFSQEHSVSSSFSLVFLLTFSFVIYCIFFLPSKKGNLLYQQNTISI